MDFTQRKLSKSEWVGLEIPVPPSELKIIQLIKTGYSDLKVYNNNVQSVLSYLKIQNNEGVDSYVFETYFLEDIKKLGKKFDLPDSAIPLVKKHALKKADLFRIQNSDTKINENKPNIFEFVLFKILADMFSEKKNTKKTKWVLHYYTLQVLLTYKIDLVNQTLVVYISNILASILNEISIKELIYNGQELIEKNKYLLKFANDELYDHQKQLFTISKSPSPKLILYIAPTGTGKTLSPIGLSEHHRIIFVCAARHVGLALAKSAISINKKVAFAFGCSDANDIRLHYYAAKTYDTNKRSGGIGKVDNSDGTNVDIIITDIKSYLYAMYYMLAFNEKEKIIAYWDEPTITMDYETHPLHEIIHENWKKNKIPNMVLSSATLPHKEDLYETIQDFSAKFADSEVYEIVSYDCKKTIPLITKEGFTEMPHFMSNKYDEITNMVNHCLRHKTLLRYIDLGEATAFIKFITEHDLVDSTLPENRFIKNNISDIDAQFPKLLDVNMYNIKMHYLNLLKNIKPSHWTNVYATLTSGRKKKYSSVVNIVTNDAHTLTDGPTIFIADDVDKIAAFYIQQAILPIELSDKINGIIEFNEELNEIIKKETNELDDITKNDKDRKKGDIDRMAPETKIKMEKIGELVSSIKSVNVPPQYIPNTREHLYKYSNLSNRDDLVNIPFTGNISDEDVIKIMKIEDLADNLKKLLLIGIAVFSTKTNDKYNEIVKTLANEQKLYMIITSSDYIYGLNYQFCHGFISKDLGGISQEKCIQTMGRVGRNKIQYDYSIRFRDNSLIFKLFNKEENSPEIKNMNELFNE